jgi:hypothetical protein
LSKSSDQILAYYQKWLEISQSEHKVIKEKKWDELSSFSAAKEDLIQKLQHLQSEDPDWKTSSSPQLSILIHQVADLEELNRTLVQEGMGEIKGRLGDVERRVNTTQQVQQRYQSQNPKKVNRFSGQA